MRRTRILAQWEVVHMHSPSEAAPRASFDYSSPTRNCDIVMKGGITSGVVYPLAVCELAQAYRFRNIGGTSAGAIAAAATAAAEVGRRRGRGHGFAGLETLPAWIGSGANLLSLFQPQPATRPLYRVVMSALTAPSRKPLHVAGALGRSFPLAAAAGTLPGLLLLAAAWQQGGLLRAAAIPASILAIVVGALIGVGASFVRTLFRELPANGYGLCSGQQTNARAAALTPWLTDLLNALAGKHDPREPLVFRDLWGHADPEREKQINLEMMTTCLSQGRPYRVPFKENEFYFKPEELRRLFPDEVVDWMVAHPRGGTHDVARADGLCPLPAAADLPVVVAARLSLSFPVLISAVPLYAYDHSRRQSTASLRSPERCWFSDGGICSNFPVHFFDSLLPRWPTFAIGLRPFHPDYPQQLDEHQNVWIPRSNSAGTSDAWLRFERAPAEARRVGAGLANMRGFVVALLDAMRNWRDSLQTRVPGYRDRVVHVHLDTAREGGLNLAMPPDVLARLSERGRCAGELLRKRFGEMASREGAPSAWENHRWVRYRTTMGLLEHMLRQAVDAYEHPEAGDASYDELIRRAASESWSSYRWPSENAATRAAAETAKVLALVRGWGETSVSFVEGVPQPSPELRITPRS